jgi:hypothetical protein
MWQGDVRFTVCKNIIFGFVELEASNIPVLTQLEIYAFGLSVCY